MGPATRRPPAGGLPNARKGNNVSKGWGDVLVHCRSGSRALSPFGATASRNGMTRLIDGRVLRSHELFQSAKDIQDLFDRRTACQQCMQSPLAVEQVPLPRCVIDLSSRDVHWRIRSACQALEKPRPAAACSATVRFRTEISRTRVGGRHAPPRLTRCQLGRRQRCP
jgi:hypothetical protein